MFAFKDSLRLPIGTGNVPADRTLLTGIAGINIFNGYPSGCGFVSKELLKLKEIPFMQVLALFFTKPCALSDSAQIFKCNRVSAIKRFYNLLCNYMVSVCSETVLLLGNLLKVSFGRLATTGLQSASNLFVTHGNLFDVPSAEELVLRRNSNLLDASVNTNDFTGRHKVGNVLAENYIQEDFVFSDKQIGRTSFPFKILLKIFRDGDWNFDSSIDSKQRNLVPIKPDVITSGIITDRRLRRLWTSCFLLLLYSCLNCFYRFSRFHSGRNSKLRGKRISCERIGLVMQRNTVIVTIIPSDLTHKIKCLCVSINCRLDSFYRNIKFKFYGSCKFHVHIICMLNVKVKYYFKKLIAITRKEEREQERLTPLRYPSPA